MKDDDGLLTPAVRGREPLDLLAEEFVSRLRRGERPTIEEYVSRHAGLADEIRTVFSTLLLVEDLGKESVIGSRTLTPPSERPGKTHTSSDESLQRVGEFRLLREIGRGGMGIVYEAEQESLGRRVAIKVLPFHSLLGERHLERFRQEARAAARLSHSNIVPVFGVGEHLGLHYFVMQYVPGKGLDAFIEEVRRQREEGRRAAGDVASDPSTGGRQRYHHQVARIVRDAALALHHAHREGILHRDVKPSNLLLDPDGHVWLADFGLAKSEGSDDLTRSGDLVGTFRYMAPERFKGWSDPRSDVYSLGLTLHELLALRPAFLESDRGRLLGKDAEEPTALRRLDRSIPRDLETIVLTASATEPLHRYASAQAMARDLERYLGGEPVEARRSTTVGRLTRWLARNPVLASLGGAVLCLLVVVATISVRSAVHLKRERDIGREALRDSYVTQARALRVSRQSGQRFGALEAIVAAARIQPGSELCDEAAAALALEDARVIRSWPKRREETTCFDHELGRVATWSPGGDVVVRSLADSRELARLPGPSDDVPYADAVFHPAGQHLAVRHHRDRVFDRWTIWNLEHRTVVARVDDGAESGSLDFDPRDGSLLLPARKGALRAIEIPSGRSRVELRLPFEIRSIAIHPGGELIAVSAEGNTQVSLVERASGRVLCAFPHEKDPSALAWDPGGRFLAVACHDFRSYLWDAETGVLRWSQKGHESEVTSVAFHPRGDFFLTGGWDNRIHAWDTWSGRDLFALSRQLPRFSRDGRLASAVSDPGYDLVEIAPAPTAFTLHGHESVNEKHPHMVALAPDGRLAASCGWDGVRLWDLNARREVAQLPIGRVLSVEFEAGGGHLMTSGQAGLLRWPIRTHVSRGRRRVVLGPALSVGPFTDLWRHSLGDGGRRVAFLHGRTHGHVLPLDEPGAGVRLEDVSPVEHIALSPDARWVAGTSKELQRVVVWDGATGKRVKTLETLYGYIAFDPRSRYLVTGTHSDYLFYRTGDWQIAHRIPRAPGLQYPGPVAFDRGGQVLAVSQSETRVWLLEIESWKRIAELEAPDPRILNGLALDLGAGFLAGSSRAQRCFFWDLCSIERQLAAAEVPWDLRLGERSASGPLQVDVLHGGWVPGLEESLEDPRSAPLLRRWRHALFRPVLGSHGDIDLALSRPQFLVAEGAAWSYRRGMTEPTGDHAWSAPEFPDSTWTRGPSGFSGRGAADDETRTVLEDQARSFTTVYLRHVFHLEEVERVERLLLALRFEGGFVAYLNGREIARQNAGATDVRWPHDARASGGRSSRRQEFLGDIDPSTLVRGRNVLAIQALAHERSSLFLLPVLAAALAPDEAADGERTAALARGPDGAPDPALAAYRAGRVLQRAGKPREALDAFTRASALDVASPEPIVRSIECVLECTGPEAAVKLARSALERGGLLDDGAIWAAWSLLKFRDLHRSPEEALADWPGLAASASRHGAALRSTIEDLVERGATRINCGGPRFVARDGKVWSEDCFYLGGLNAREEPELDGTAPVSHTEDAPLYRSARSFPGDRQIRPAYRVPVPAGRYTVRLHFAETRSPRARGRTFGVRLERQLVLESHQPLRAGFATAGVPSFELEVHDGFLDLDFLAEEADPLLAAIEIERRK